MNERIERIAVQSLIEHKGELIFSKEKFAQLIVQDCVRIIETYFDSSPEIMGLPLDILEHFDMELDDE